MIVELLQKFKGKLILITLFSASSSAVSIYLLAQITDHIDLSNIDSLAQSTIMFLVFLAALFMTSFVSQFLLVKMGSTFVYQLRTQLLEQTSKVSYEKLERMGGHKVLATLTTDVNNISIALSILPVFAVNLATILFCLVYLFLQSSILFVYLIIGLLLSVSMSVMIMRVGRKRFIEMREREDKMFGVFKTLVDGSKELNINKNRRHFFHEKLAKPRIEDVREIEVKAKGYWILSDSLLRSMVFLILGIVVYVAHTLYNIDTTVLTSFVLFTTYIINPINFLQSTFQAFIRGKIGYNKIASLDLSPSKQLTTAIDKPLADNWQQLTFKEMTYQYQSDQNNFKFAIGPIDLTIKQGENIFICGGNGSGKSTFAKVLVGLYKAQGGEILFNNEKIEEANLQWYRNHFSTIFSDFYLFDHVLDNQGQLVNSEKVQKHLEKLELAKKVEVLDGQISSTKLSQGQRKRLAMLLVYMEDAPIYLFDEWAADQDPTFREYFYEELLPELKASGKTLIVITHDDKYFSLADKLIKFDNGQLTEQKNKLYYEEGQLSNG